ncbi:MAG: lipopolysaccharide biosynthesis protein [Ferruginibacter sp.]|nr:lipopolysaccharide biosynthesis protein [Ferruginibacter sp.]
MSNQIPNDEVTAKEVITKIKEWYTYLLSKWMVILLFGITGGLLGLTYSFMQKFVYTASLSFALEDQEQGGAMSSGALGLASQFGFDIGETRGGIFAGANLIELFKSRSMVEQTLLSPVTIGGKTISFAEMYIQNLKWRDKWAKNAKFKNIQFLPNANRQQFSRAQDSILGVMYQGLSIGSLKVDQKDKKVDIITIDMKSPDENFAKYFTEALAKVVSDFYIMTKTKKARINMEILEKQTDSIRGELNAAITGVAVANDNTFSLNPALNVRRAPSSRRQVDVQANTAILTELVKQTELAKVVLRKETPLIQVIDLPIFPLKKERFGKLKGLVFGGFLAGIIILFILIIKRVIKQIDSA